MKGFKKCHISNGKVESDDDIVWNGSEGDGNVSVRKIKALTLKMDTLTPIGKDR
jgi:hypothetical protein